MPVIGRGLLADAFASAADIDPNAIVCASGVSDSGCTDESAFHRERLLLYELIERARQREAVLVYFSGAPVYGGSTGLLTEGTPVSPETPYGRHKRSCETLIVDSGARHLVLRLPNVVGPGGHSHQLIPSLVDQILAGSVLVKLEATRDLLDVDDLVAIVAALLRGEVENHVLNVSSGVSTSARRLVDIISTVLCTRPSVLVADGGDRQEFSTAKVRDLLGGYPNFAPDYPEDLLRRRVPAIARVLRDRKQR